MSCCGSIAHGAGMSCCSIGGEVPVELDGTPVVYPVGFTAGTTSSVKTWSDNSTFAHYMGRAVRDVAAAVLRFAVTTAQSQPPTWAEVGLGIGRPSLGILPTITPVAFADVTTQVASTGNKSVVIVPSLPLSAGDDVWLLFGCQPALIARGTNVADAIVTELRVILGSVGVGRPSLNLGVPIVAASSDAGTFCLWAALDLGW